MMTPATGTSLKRISSGIIDSGGYHTRLNRIVEHILKSRDRLNGLQRPDMAGMGKAVGPALF